MALDSAVLFLCLAVVVSSVSNGEKDPEISCSYGFKTEYNGTESSDGTLITHTGDVYPKDTWQRFGNVFHVCKCIARPCFRKCCPEGQEVYFENATVCVDVPDSMQNVTDFRPVVYSERGLVPIIFENEKAKYDQHFDTIYGFPCPDDKELTIPEIGHLLYYYFLENGELADQTQLGLDYYGLSHFCFLTILDDEYVMAQPLMCSIPVKSHPVRFILYSAGMIISLPCLGITFLVHVCIKALFTTHGKCLMSHVLSLMFGYICLAILGTSVNSLSQEVCIAVAFIIYFAFLASFFWLNVMCLDIWWTFSGFRPLRGSVKEREHKKFVIYSLYCWGSPLLMLIICLIMDLHPGIPETYEKPGFGEKKCWFRSTVSNLIYFNGPIAILIVCNIVLFILTAIKICQVKRGAKILKKQDSRRHYNEEENNTKRFNLYLKLFLVMGVNWIMEVVSFAAGGPDEWWYVTDIANTLQGVLIFIIFVWKQRIRRLLGERFCPSRFPNTNSMTNSSTRMTAIRRNGSEMSSGRSSLKTTQEGQPMKVLPSAPAVRSDDSDAA